MSNTGLFDEKSLEEMLFDRMPMGIAVLDTSFNIQRYNPTWSEFSARYAPASGAPLTEGVNYFEHLPGTEPVILPLFKKVLEGETVRQDNLRLETGENVTYWDVVLAPLTDQQRISGILNVAVDVTQRMESQLHLEERVEKRTRELDRRREIAESLRDIIGMINANLPLDTFLERSVKLATEQLEAKACVLHRFDLPNQTITNLAGYNVDDIFTKGTTVSFSELKERGAEAYVQATIDKKPTYNNYPPLPERVDQIRRDPDIPDELKPSRITLRQRFAGVLSIPLFIRNEIYGGMVFYYTEPQDFSQDQIELGLTFAEQVSLAIENARLFEQTEETAVMAERNRLARDLHDAVTQTLFSSSLIAEVLPRIWENDQMEGQKRLEELRQLTRGALSEMRTLLLELRPAALADADLKVLISHLINAFTARTRLQVNYQEDFRDNPPLEIKEMIYRITQEGLNNIAKHANASQVYLELVSWTHFARLALHDDGVGFDTKDQAREGLGLGIMQERAKNLGAEITVNSKIGQGTEITLVWEKAEEEEKINA